MDAITTVVETVQCTVSTVEVGYCHRNRCELVVIAMRYGWTRRHSHKTIITGKWGYAL